MNPPYKIKPLPSQSIKVTRDNLNKIRKYGKHHTHHINIIEINAEELIKPTNIDNRIFIRSLKEIYRTLQFRSIKKFHYNFFVTTIQEISHLSAVLRKLCFRRLEYLNITTGKTEAQIKDKDLKPWSKNIRRFTNLKTLQFGIYDFYCSKGRFFAPMARSFEKLNKLQSLNFVFNGFEILPESLLMLGKAFSRLNRHNLTNLGLHIGRVSIDLDMFIKELGQCVQDLSNLKSLKLHFSGNRQVTPDAISSFLERISHAKSLTILGIYYPNDRAQKALLKDIAILKNLKSIDFTLFRVNNDDLLVYAENLRQLASLEEFRLSLDYPEGGIFLGYDDSAEAIDRKTLAVLCNSLKIHASRLRVLELIISSRLRTDFEIPSLTRKALLHVADLIANCVNLEHLTLFLANEQREQSIISLFESMRNTNHLKRLFLYLQGESTTDAPLEVLGRVISNNQNLENLNIFFKNFESITDQGISKVSQALSDLQNLRLFNLEFKYSPHLTNISLDDAVEALKKVKSLEWAELCFILEAHSFMQLPHMLEPLTEGNIKVREKPFSTLLKEKKI